jgi:hypothetical protein
MARRKDGTIRRIALLFHKQLRRFNLTERGEIPAPLFTSTTHPSDRRQEEIRGSDMRIQFSVIPLSLALMAATALTPAPALAQIGIGVGVGGIGVGVSVRVAPPPLPVYVQPPIPAPGYLWNPGYWAWNDTDYYWVPGTWAEPPAVGLLWTPPYWGFAGGLYGFHAGYWGAHVGFYGGINYGFGYTSAGFFGGRWEGGAFRYNSAVNNFGGVHITNVYNERVTNENGSRAAFNGPGGAEGHPTPEQEAAEHEQHTPPTENQMKQAETARSNPELRASANHGNPSIAATQKPGEFKGPGVVAAREKANLDRADAAKDKANAMREREKTNETHADTSHARAQTVESRADRERNHAAQRTAAAKTAHPERAAHPDAAAHPARASHQAAAPHPQMARATPRPEAAPHPAEARHAEARPEEKK